MRPRDQGTPDPQSTGAGFACVIKAESCVCPQGSVSQEVSLSPVGKDSLSVITLGNVPARLSSQTCFPLPTHAFLPPHPTFSSFHSSPPPAPFFSILSFSVREPEEQLFLVRRETLSTRPGDTWSPLLLLHLGRSPRWPWRRARTGHSWAVTITLDAGG